MRRRLKFHFVGTLLLVSNVAQAFILLTASMDDVKRIAKKFVSDSLADQITDMLAKASEQMNTNLSVENEQNEDEFENISNELFSTYKVASKDTGRQRFETKWKRDEKDASVTTNFDRSNTFMEWDGEQMKEISKEQQRQNADIEKPKSSYHDEDRFIDTEFDNYLKLPETRGNERLNENKQNNQLGQEDSEHELENVRFDHEHEVHEYQHEPEKPTNDFDLKFNKQSEESKEAAQPDTESKKDIEKEKKIGPERDGKTERNIVPKKDTGPKRDIGKKRDIAPTRNYEPKSDSSSEIDFAPKKDTKNQKPMGKKDETESQSSDELKIQKDYDAQSSEARVILRHGTVPPPSTTPERSRYIQFMQTTKKDKNSSDTPKDNNSMVKRPHHRLADSNEIKEDVLNIPDNAVPFLKTIDDREYNEQVERRGIVSMKDLLATSGPITLPKINNKRIDKETSPVENESWI